MADVKDIMGVPRSAPLDRDEKKDKKEKIKRPEGMSREAFALLGGSNPLIPAQLVDGLKRKKDVNKKPKVLTKGIVVYRLKPFRNPARSDNLELRHWVKGYKDAAGRVRDAEEGDYPFARFNKKVQVPRYDDDEWETIVKPLSDGWAKGETNYLLDLCEQFSLRWVVITDRYEFPGGTARSMEDLKERYYSLSRALLVAREGGEAPVANQLIVKFPYNAAHERERKRALEMLLARNARREREENQVLEAAKRIDERWKMEAASRAAGAAAGGTPPPHGPGVRRGPAGHAAVASHSPASGVAVPSPAGAHPGSSPAISLAGTKFPVDFPNKPGKGVPYLLDMNLQPRSMPPGVYVHSIYTQEVATQQANAFAGTSSRVQKAVDHTMTELGCGTMPGMATRAVLGQYLALRAEVMAYHELRRQLQNRQFADEGRSGGKRTEKRKRLGPA